MKVWIPMLILLLAATGLCVWDSIHTNQTLRHMTEQSEQLYNQILVEDISDEQLKNQIYKLNDYWTKKMDILSISISRKDLQPVSDYLQYLYASTINENQEDAITYSRLLNYNIVGISETNGINLLNLI